MTPRLLTASILLAMAPAALLGQEKSLAARLEPLVKAHKGKVAIALKHLDSGESYHLDADEEMPTASLIKFMIMLEVYLQVSEGKVKLADMVTLKEKDKVPGSGILTYHFSEGATFSLRDATRLMMVYSDNTATNLVLDKIGIASTTKRMEDWGLKGTKLNAKVFLGKTTSINPERTKKFGLGSTTANETVHLLEKVHLGKVVSPEVCKEMLGHMKKCDDKTKLKRYLPAKIEVAHKTGAVDAAKTDAGILYLPERPRCHLLRADGSERGQRFYKDDNTAHILHRPRRRARDL